MLRKANWKDKLLYRIGRRKIFRVAGDSMLPTLKDGDAVMIVTRSPASVGDIVLAQHPYKQSVKMLKRVAAIDESGRYELVGDNAHGSSDSRMFGTIAIEHVLGKAVCVVK
ncbi:MAG TPA: nickel-type superoxide dismutase maturation protease [Pyrinomonadaceae bacterium]|nr:nickel-type superoxide dismutase maturation protease [Pyrinomonadaceae bacterium]